MIIRQVIQWNIKEPTGNLAQDLESLSIDWDYTQFDMISNEVYYD